MLNYSLFDRQLEIERRRDKMNLYNLPEEILEAIFAFLDQRDRLAVRLVCRKFARAADRGSMDFLHTEAPAPLEQHAHFATTTAVRVQGDLAAFFTEKEGQVADMADLTWANMRELHLSLSDGTGIVSRQVWSICNLRVFTNLSLLARHEFSIDSDSTARMMYVPLIESRCTIGWRKYAFYHGTGEIFRITRGEVTRLGRLMFGSASINPTRSASTANVLAFIRSSMERDVLVYGEDEERGEIVQLRCFRNGDTHRFWMAGDGTDVLHASDTDHHLEFWALNADGTEAVAAVPESRYRCLLDE